MTGGERPSGAIVRTALFAILFMGSVLVYVPYILASGPGTAHSTLGPWRYLGLLPLAAGIAGLGRCLRDFAVVGRGTPAPFDPTAAAGRDRPVPLGAQSHVSQRAAAARR